MLSRCLRARQRWNSFLDAPRYRRFTQRQITTLAIETSCDDTCVAIVEHNDGKDEAEDAHIATAAVHFHQKITAPNTGKGGIHPSEAAASHRSNLANVVKNALRAPWPATTEQDAPLAEGRRPDFVSVTRGPGMQSNLYCGIDTAKGIAAAYDIPLIGIHHMQAHALTPRLVNALQSRRSGEKLMLTPAFPFLTLLVSGGHTMLLHSKSLTDHCILANTMDIAIGDCLDKCGRAILPEEIRNSTPDTSYAKYLTAYAFPEESTFTNHPIPARRSDEIDKPANQYGWQMPSPLSETRKLAFSYAGFVSHVERLVNSRDGITDAERLTLAQSALGAAFEHLCSRTILALESLRDQHLLPSTLVVSGGVAANDYLRYFLRQFLDIRGFRDTKLIFPPNKLAVPVQKLNDDGQVIPDMLDLELCTDNAAMIGWAGIEMYLAGWRNDLSINAKPKWSMDNNVDGGIVGASGTYYLAE
jgi:N6-L-threonylcarbamoyladenine synthase